MACWNYLWPGAMMLVATAALTAALADDAGEFTFTVLRGGDPVGQHRIAFDREGDRIEIREKTEIEVRFAMIPIYRFEHEGSEVWEKGRAVRIDGVTNDNGEKFAIAVRRNGDGYTRVINGRVDKFDERQQVFAFWDKDVLNYNDFFSAIDDKTMKVSFRFIGRETITVAGKELDVEHYRMVGDEERDLWFDKAGRIAKVAFRRLGSEIAYVRDQLTPLPPAPSCSSRC